MFGFIYWIAYFISWFKDHQRVERSKEKNKREMLKQGRRDYWDCHGQEYFDDEPCFRSNRNGHDVLVSAKTLKTIYDYTEIEEKKREEKIKKQIEENKEKGIPFWIDPSNWVKFEIATKRPYEVVARGKKYYKHYLKSCGQNKYIYIPGQCEEKEISYRDFFYWCSDMSEYNESERFKAEIREKAKKLEEERQNANK